jgi:hypothetical protein
VVPEDDIFPVRTVYNGRTQNIGLNYLTSKKPIWYAGPDVIASCLLAKKPPRILRAIRMVPSGRQAGLERVKLGNSIEIDPKRQDFYRHVIEQKTALKETNKSGARFMKTLGTSGSYGLFVEVNQEKGTKPTLVKVFSGEITSEHPCTTLERPGRWYFPPVASLITSGGRLLLAMLERCVMDAGGSYLFCDTDSLCIVSNEHGGLIACPGGEHRLKDGRGAIKALLWEEVSQIAKRFEALNPYDRHLVKELLKIEDVNFVDNDPKKARRQLYGYANSAKRYVLFEWRKNDISVEKASGHGLGYLYPPTEEFNQKSNVHQWVIEAWDWILRRELGLKYSDPHWIDYPAMMRMTLTSPNILRNCRPEWLCSYNFFFYPVLSSIDGYPAGCDRPNFRFITPFNSDRKRWSDLKGVNTVDSKEYSIAMVPNGKQDHVQPESLRTILRQYLRRPESKSLAPDGGPCAPETVGLLKRASVVASDIVPVGKETDRRWEQGEDMSLLDFEVLEYRDKMAVADPDLRNRLVKQGIRATMRSTGLSQHTLEAVCRGQSVRRATLMRLVEALGIFKPA